MSQALYRRYRPDNFTEMIGQDQVTAPLMQALRSNRVNHAYLFSGPRGCGKTTSARILARILNCHENTEADPKDTPCGACPSCIELARGGSGSLDVVEIDAASHGGVDDARELRERATFSPSRDRFKIFILDEAHMVTAQGFNALLKIVEEPPSYLKFIFATTEPDKVIGTIRSRTHHYPFKLVGPAAMQGYLEQLCTAENIAVGAGVLPLVVRAGGGSVRDTLSVLDQLMAGSGQEGLEYDRAVGLLGFTPVTLLDDVVEALSARDGASMFRVVEQIISTGHEPRRFVEDLLERLRDLVIIALSGDNARSVLTSIPQDQFDRMTVQASNLGASELSRSADVVNDALSSMTGATSPRLHLELLCARLLLPAADSSSGGLGARIDGLERALATGGVALTSSGPAAPAAVAPSGEPAAPRKSLRPDSTRVPAKRPESTRLPKASATAPTAPTVAPATPIAPDPVVPAVAAAPVVATPAPVVQAPPVAAPVVIPEPVAPVAPVTPVAPVAAMPPAAQPSVVPEVVTSEPVAAPAPIAPQVAPMTPAVTTPPVGVPEPAVTAPTPVQDTGALQTEALRRRWPEVLEALSKMRRATWTLVDQHVQIAGLTANTLQIALPSPGLVKTFENMQGPELLSAAINTTLGFDVKIVPQVGTGDLPKAPSTVPVAQPGAQQDVQQAPVTPIAQTPAAPVVQAPVVPAAPVPAVPVQEPAAPVAQDWPAEPQGWETGPVEPQGWATGPAEPQGWEPEPEQVPVPAAQSVPASESPVESLPEPTPEPMSEPTPAPAVEAPVNMFGAAAAAFAQNHKVDPFAENRLGAIAAPVVDQVQAGAQTQPVRPAYDEQSGNEQANPPEPDFGGEQYASEPPVQDQVPPWEEETPRQVAERLAAQQEREEAQRVYVKDDPQPDDEDLEHSNLVGVPLLIQKLGGVVIDEVVEDRPYQ